MTPSHLTCAEALLLIQADLDGELDASAAAHLAAHLDGCAACAAEARDMSALSRRVRDLPQAQAPERLRAAVLASLARSGETAAPEPADTGRAAAPAVVPFPRRPNRTLGRRGLMIGGALAAAIAGLAVLPLRRPASSGERLADAVVDSHLRALQPGHLIDVASSDRHTVKPWFDGRIDFAPPVRDLAAEGFPLIGGRLDYLAGHPVAAMAYRRDQHIIDLYVWPVPGSSASAASPDASESGARAGYSWRRWRDGSLIIRIVSDVEPADLIAFQQAWSRNH